MPYIDQNIYTQYTKPSGTGGKIIPVDNGFLYIGEYGQDPAAEDSRVAVYYVDEAQNQIEVTQPIRLSDAGVPTYGGNPFHPFVEVSKYSVSVRDKNKTELFTNKFIGTVQAISLLEAACLSFNLPTSEAGNSVKSLVVGLDLDDTYGIVAPDGSLWINNSNTGQVEAIPSPFLGILTVSGSSVQLVKKRDENRYMPNYNYLTGDVVIGVDNKSYVALVNNGPSYGGAIEPTGIATATWRKPKTGVGELVSGTSPTLAPYDDCVAGNGQELSRAEYADLYTYALTNMAASEGAKTDGQYGPGDGATTFTVPAFHGYFPRFWDNGVGIDSEPLRVFGSTQGDAIRNITGYANTGSQYFDNAVGGAMYKTQVRSTRNNGADTENNAVSIHFDASRQVPTASENRVKNVTVFPWIRAK